ncbi:MAG: hypothetical protein ACLVB3_09470 [Clostridium sp.]
MVFWDTEKMVPVRVMPEDASCFWKRGGIHQEKRPGKSLDQPEEYEEGIPVASEKHHLDVN